jgi:hypothetical protein
MSSEIIRELFRNLENTLHDRLKVIEDILQTQPSSSTNQTVVARLDSLEKYTKGEFTFICSVYDKLAERVTVLEENLTKLLDKIVSSKSQEDEKPVEAVEAEIEVEQAEAEALDAENSAVEIETTAKVALQKAVDALPEESAETDSSSEAPQPEFLSDCYENNPLLRFPDDASGYVYDIHIPTQEVYKQTADGDKELVGRLGQGKYKQWYCDASSFAVKNRKTDEELSVGFNEEEDAESEEQLTEFVYKKTTYYRDSENKVYSVDEEGDLISQPIGIWDETTKKILT